MSLPLTIVSASSCLCFCYCQCDHSRPTRKFNSMKHSQSLTIRFEADIGLQQRIPIVPVQLGCHETNCSRQDHAQMCCTMLQILKAAKSFSSVWQDGKTELAKDVLADNVVSKDLLFGNEIHGFDNWSNMVHGVFEVSCHVDTSHWSYPLLCCHTITFTTTLSLLPCEHQIWCCLVPFVC